MKQLVTDFRKLCLKGGSVFTSFHYRYCEKIASPINTRYLMCSQKLTGSYTESY